VRGFSFCRGWPLRLFNLYLGTQHGYSVVSELRFFAIVFGIPALAALIVMRWARSAASQP
jgi:hypothetical protein